MTDMTTDIAVSHPDKLLYPNEKITKWRKAESCGGEKDEDKCWCEPGRDGKCWVRSSRRVVSRWTR